MPTIEEALAHAGDIAAFEASYVWHKAYVFRRRDNGAPLPPDIEDTREVLLEKRAMGGAVERRVGEAAARVGAMRARLATFPMLAKVDRIRVRPNRPLATLQRLLDAVSPI
jgi:hypothetical protein